jgi:pyridoxal phosphate enzyme (YggS family)
MSMVTDNYNAVRAEFEQVCTAAGRSTGEVKLLVVSKTIPVPVLMELYDLGIREFAENREPELAMKAAAMPDDIVWHFIGPVQSNKIRKVVKLAQVIHSVESVSQLERFDRIAGEEGKNPQILLELNVSGEASKGGMPPAELPAAAEVAAACKNLRFAGLMTMAPFEAETAELEQIFSTLKKLRDTESSRLNIALPVLSMGMSGDFPEAIKCGATVVRIGSKIFEGIERISK